MLELVVLPHGGCFPAWGSLAMMGRNEIGWYPVRFSADFPGLGITIVLAGFYDRGASFSRIAELIRLVTETIPFRGSSRSLMCRMLSIPGISAR